MKHTAVLSLEFPFDPLQDEAFFDWLVSLAEECRHMSVKLDVLVDEEPLVIHRLDDTGSKPS